MLRIWKDPAVLTDASILPLSQDGSFSNADEESLDSSLPDDGDYRDDALYIGGIRTILNGALAASVVGNIDPVVFATAPGWEPGDYIIIDPLDALGVNETVRVITISGVNATILRGVGMAPGPANAHVGTEEVFSKYDFTSVSVAPLDTVQTTLQGIGGYTPDEANPIAGTMPLLQFDATDPDNNPPGVAAYAGAFSAEPVTPVTGPGAMPDQLAGLWKTQTGITVLGPDPAIPAQYPYLWKIWRRVFVPTGVPAQFKQDLRIRTTGTRVVIP